jgi:magnesium-transporting ATPase (P-type)
MDMQPTTVQIEDIKKIHSEINQISNQRFILNTFAVTVFGAIISIGVNKLISDQTQQSYDFSCLLSVLLNAALITIFNFNYHLSTMLCTYATYLVVKYNSEWELDWKKYRTYSENACQGSYGDADGCLKQRYVAYSFLSASSFTILCIISTVMPTLMMKFVNTKIETNWWTIISIISGIMSLRFIWKRLDRRSEKEEIIKHNWERVLETQKTKDQ